VRAGQTVLMQFPDGTVAPIPVRNIAEAKQAQARIYRRSLTPMGRPPGIGDVAKAAALRLADIAPTAGAIGGGVAGGGLGAVAGIPGGPPGAAVAGFAGRTAGGVIGGGLGQAAREAIYSATGQGDAPGTVGGEMRSQAILGPLGEAGGAAVGLLGKGAIRMGLPARVQDAGRVIGEMVKEKIPVGGPGWTGGSTMANVPILGPMFSKGSTEAARNFGEKTAAREAINMAGDAAGVLIPRKAAEDVLEGLINKASAEMGDDAEVAYFKRVLDSWRRRKAPDLAPTEVQRVVTRFNKRSGPIMKAMAKGESIPTASLQRRAAQEIPIATAFSNELADRVPGWREYTTKLATSIATKDAVKKAENQALRTLGSRLATGGALVSGGEAVMGERDPARLAQHGLLGALGGAALSSPALLSRAGLLFNDPFLQAVLRQAPRTYNQSGQEAQ